MKEKIIDIYREAQRNVSREAFKVTCHILQAFGKDLVKPAGSGVLIKAGKLHFLITAAHVTEDLNDNIFLGIEEYTVYRPGGVIVTNSPEKSRDEDRLDICILELNEESNKKLNKIYEFLDINEVGINHVLKPYPMYELVGFPASKSKFSKYKKKLNSVAYQYVTQPADSETYKQLKCNPAFNIIVKYDRKKVYNYATDSFQTGPELYGISGCGLWFTPPENVMPNHKPRKELVGIITEWPKNHRKFLIATRIDVISEILRIKYGCGIPKSNVLHLNIEE